MKIIIETIPHNQQRYPTVGDWIFKENGDLIIYVSDMKNWKYEFLVGLHEAVEAVLCNIAGVNEQDVTDFDIKFEEERESGLHSATAEPGDHKKAPYRKQHIFATEIEKKMCKKMGLKWKEYDKTVNSL